MQSYSFIQKLFHDFVLSKKLINKSLFELEKKIYLKNIDIQNQPHLFICGLPRSGTTSLLNFFYSSSQYASLTYKNMPFLLSPNFSNFFSKKNVPRKERIHGDGIAFDINSPEALDEVFFDNSDEFIKSELLNYIQLILSSKNKFRYLSKNNLNFKRVDLINSILPNSIFLIPIRHPLYHANSLLNQHLNFCQLQKKDNFIKRYMNYLGHKEFGLDHAPWNTPIYYHDFNKIDYWLEQWTLFYKNIYNKYSSYKNCHFVLYEELSNQNYLTLLLKKINFKKINNLNLTYFKNSNIKELNILFSQDSYNKAKDLYNSFDNKSMSKKF